VVVADFLTDSTGEEVLFLQYMDYGTALVGYSFGPDGLLTQSVIAGETMGYLSKSSHEIFAQIMPTPPSLMPAPMNLMPLGGGIMLLPSPPP
jgi:hypothetical protein